MANMVYSALSVIAFITMTFLFWAQSVEYNGDYTSDMKSHITKPLANGGHGYSLEGKFVVLFDRLTHGSTIGFAAFLALLVILTPLAVRFLLCQFDQMDSAGTPLGKIRNQYIGLWSIFTAPIVIPGVWFWFYKNTMNINAWHNSTSMEMRLFSVLALAVYFKIQSDMRMRGGLRITDWFILSMTLFLSTWFKPSFFVGFAPVMLMCLIVDFVSHRKDFNYIKRIFAFGCAALPASGMVILQYWKLYGSREDISLVLNKGQNHALYIFRLCIFLIIPLTVFIYNGKKIISDHRSGNTAYVQIWILWAIEVAYHFLLSEKGRSGGNFGWGVRIGNFLVAVVSFRLFWQNVLTMHEIKKQEGGLSKIDVIYGYIIGFLLVWEFIWGIYYYVHILTGARYDI